MNTSPGTAVAKTHITDEWRISSVAIEREMERIAGLLQKTIQFESRTSTPHSAIARRKVGAALVEACSAVNG